jgi:CheY-like chemotaxis protein
MEDIFLNPINILLVEDNPGDIKLIKKFFEIGKLLVNLEVVTDGSLALDYIYKIGDYSDVKTPDLIILDLNLPKVDGREILEEIKKNDQLKKIPVFVMTMSEMEEDLLKANHLEANAYLTKPFDYDKFVSFLFTLEDFKIAIVKTSRTAL